MSVSRIWWARWRRTPRRKEVPCPVCRQAETQLIKKRNFTMSKKLVAYFSASGVTAAAAKSLADRVSFRLWGSRRISILARAPRVVYVQHQDSLPFRRKTAPRIADSCAFANAPMTACLKTRPKSTSFALSVSPFFNPKGPVSPYLTQKNRVKSGQIRPNLGKGYQRFSKEKTPENRIFRGF